MTKKEKSMNSVPIILLAAGASKRMGTPKQLLAWNGITLIEHQINENKLATYWI